MLATVCGNVHTGLVHMYETLTLLTDTVLLKVRSFLWNQASKPVERFWEAEKTIQKLLNFSTESARPLSKANVVHSHVLNIFYDSFSMKIYQYKGTNLSKFLAWKILIAVPID